MSLDSCGTWPMPLDRAVLGPANSCPVLAVRQISTQYKENVFERVSRPRWNRWTQEAGRLVKRGGHAPPALAPAWAFRAGVKLR